jgi:hypothetical protein
MNFVKTARYLEEYKIFVEFTSGESGIVDLKESVFRYAAAAEIRDPAKFREFYLDDWPTIAWKCGFDLSPETLHELMTGRPFIGQASANSQMATV